MSAEVYVVVSFSNRKQPGLFRLTSAEKVMKIYSSKKYAKNSFNCEQIKRVKFRHSVNIQHSGFLEH